MTTSPIPGRDLSYADLTAPGQSQDIRSTWSLIGHVAQALGLEVMRSTGASVRSKTIGELADEIIALLPQVETEQDLAVMLDGSGDLEGRNRKVTFEVRRLRTVEEAEAGVQKVWRLVSEWPTEQEAHAVRAELAENGFAAVVIRISAVWEWDYCSQ